MTNITIYNDTAPTDLAVENDKEQFMPGDGTNQCAETVAMELIPSSGINSCSITSVHENKGPLPGQQAQNTSELAAESTMRKGQKTKTRKEKTNEDQSKWISGMVLEEGRWLKLKAFQNKSGSWSYRVEGHLPPCHTEAPADLEEMLKQAQSDEGLRRNTDDRGIAKGWLHDLEQLCEGVSITSTLRRTRLSEELLRRCQVMVDAITPYLELVPNAIEISTTMFVEAHANILSDLTLQELVRRMVGEVKGKVTKKRLQRYRTAINDLCSVIGRETGIYIARNKEMHDIHISYITRDKLKTYIADCSYRRVVSYMPVIKTTLNWAVKNHYLAANPANGLDLRALRTEIIARKCKEIPVNTVEEVQIALNMGAEYRGGIFLPQVILLYYAAFRPDCELESFKREYLKLDEGLIRLFTTKTLSRRVIYLPANAIAMLRHYWPEGELRWDGWDEFEQMIHAAQGYESHAPAWFKKRLPPPSKGPYVPDITRKTGCSHLNNWEPNSDRAADMTDHDPEVCKRNYDGLAPKAQSARFYAGLPVSMEKTADTLESIRKELVQKGLLPNGQLPDPPQVPTIDVNPPERKYWVPSISDEEIMARLEKNNSKTVAKDLGTSQGWFLSYCRAINIRMPKPGRGPRIAADMKVPLPPLVTLSNAELEATIKEEHGVIPTARRRGIDPMDLTAYCVVNGIALPSQREIALYYNNRNSIRKSPLQVKEMLANDSPESVATELKVTLEHLEQFCERHGLIIREGKRDDLANKSLDAIIAEVGKEIANRDGGELRVCEAIELALRHAPQGLTHDELLTVLGANGIKCTINSIRYNIRQPGNGRIRHVLGRVRLVQPSESPVNLEQLKAELAQATALNKPANILEAIKMALVKTRGGLKIDDLFEVLPALGLNVNKEVLISSVRRYMRQARLQYYYGVVTLPDKEPEWKPRVREQEATPNFDSIKTAIHKEYNALANKTFTNVQLMEFILSKAHQGLWQKELIAIAELLGIDFKDNCIHSVVHHEAKGRFVCQLGRVLIVGPPPPPRATLSEIQKAVALELADGAELDRNVLIKRVLRHFFDGLSIDDLMAAVRLAGHNPSRDTLRRRLYVMAKAGTFKIDNGQVILPDLASQEAA